MKVNFGPRGRLQIDEARIIYRNFAGAPSQFNREGDRNFSVVIPDEEIADALAAEGWNVKIKEREDGSVLMVLPVKIKFNERGPKIYLQSGKSRNILSEDECARLDKIAILCVNMDLRPYDWDINGKTGRTAYLDAIEVYQEMDRFAERYAEEEGPEE